MVDRSRSFPKTTRTQRVVASIVVSSRDSDGLLSKVHLPGVGDFNIAAIKRLSDPCPPPMETEAERRKASARKPDEKSWAQTTSQGCCL